MRKSRKSVAAEGRRNANDQRFRNHRPTPVELLQRAAGCPGQFSPHGHWRAAHITATFTTTQASGKAQTAAESSASQRPGLHQDQHRSRRRSQAFQPRRPEQIPDDKQPIPTRQRTVGIKPTPKPSVSVSQTRANELLQSAYGERATRVQKRWARGF